MNQKCDRKKKIIAELYRSNSGTTLVEIIVCLAIVSIVGAMTMHLLSTSSKLFVRTKDEASVQVELQLVSEHMNNELIKAMTVVDLTNQRYLFVQDQKNGVVVYCTDHKIYQRELYLSVVSSDYLDKFKEQAAEEHDTYNGKRVGALIASNVTNFHISSNLTKVYSFTITMTRDSVDKTCTKQVALRNDG